MKKLNLILISLIALFFINAGLPACKLFNADGKKAKFDSLVNDALKADVVLFGELHNNSIGHWLQLELTKAMFEKKSTNLVLGAEMFETDQQLIMNEYLSELVSESNFEKGTHLWNNYKTDYKPLVDFARKNDLSFIGTNIPRRYASIVSKTGMDSLGKLLNKHAKMFIAPFPVPYDPELPGYKNMAHGGMPGGMNFLPEAQAIKDATMAYFIINNLKEGQTFLHYNGAYHSQNYEGIVWYLNKYKPGLKILTITTVEQKELDKVDEKNIKQADYIFVVDEDVTKTY